MSTAAHSGSLTGAAAASIGTWMFCPPAVAKLGSWEMSDVDEDGDGAVLLLPSDDVATVDVSHPAVTALNQDVRTARSTLLHLFHPHCHQILVQATLVILIFSLGYAAGLASPSLWRPSAPAETGGAVDPQVASLFVAPPINCSDVAVPALPALVCPPPPPCPALPEIAAPPACPLPPPPAAPACPTCDAGPPPVFALSSDGVPPHSSRLDGGVWNGSDYAAWLSSWPPSPSSDASSTAYSMRVDSGLEDSGSLSISQVHVFVLTSAGYHRSRADAVMSSWGSEVPPGHLYMYSDQDDDLQQLPVVPFTHTPGIVTVPGGVGADGQPFPTVTRLAWNGSDHLSGYERAQFRWLLGMQHSFPLIEADPSVRWLLIVDDDTYVHWPNLLRVAAQYNSSEVHAVGLINTNLKGHHTLNGGAGWLLSRPVITATAPHLDDCYAPFHSALQEGVNRLFWDIQLVECLSNMTGLDTHNRPEFNRFQPRHFSRRRWGNWMDAYMRGEVNSATFHYVQPAEMLQIHNLLMVMGITGAQVHLGHPPPTGNSNK